jgi:hypothetical protein
MRTCNSFVSQLHCSARLRGGRPQPRIQSIHALSKSVTWHKLRYSLKCSFSKRRDNVTALYLSSIPRILVPNCHTYQLSTRGNWPNSVEFDLNSTPVSGDNETNDICDDDIRPCIGVIRHTPPFQGVRLASFVTDGSLHEM